MRVSEELTLLSRRASFAYFLSVINTIKFGYNELSGALNICSLYPWNRYNRQTLFSKLTIPDQLILRIYFVVALNSL